MKILVINCGSSSIKYQLLDLQDNANLLAKGVVERIGLKMGEFTHKVPNKENHVCKQPIPTHKKGIDLILKTLIDPTVGVLTDLHEIGACGHRVAHGGEYFTDSVLVGEKEKQQIRALCELAPLHNPANLEGIEAMEKLLPGVPQVAVFDTSFHATIPPEAYLYAIPYEYYTKYKIRRYGFHGTSHKFVAPKAAQIVGMDYENTKIISCHLGNGASVAAVKNGKSIDTSMGFTPVEGLMMGTRCGDIDAGLLLYLAEKEHLNNNGLNNLINKKSGLLGISGNGVDMRDICAAHQKGDLRNTYAFQMFGYRVKKYIGAYAAAMGGVDIILFTGGIGENSWQQRAECCKGLEFLGTKLDMERNKEFAGKDGIFSTDDSRVKLVSVTTDEEFVIANDTYRLAKK